MLPKTPVGLTAIQPLALRRNETEKSYSCLASLFFRRAILLQVFNYFQGI